VWGGGVELEGGEDRRGEEERQGGGETGRIRGREGKVDKGGREL